MNRQDHFNNCEMINQSINSLRIHHVSVSRSASLTFSSSLSMLVSHAIFLWSSGISSTSPYRSKCKRASFSCISLTCSIWSMEHSLPGDREEEEEGDILLVNTVFFFPGTTECLEFPRVEVVKEAEQAVLHLLHVGHVRQEGVLDDRGRGLVRFAPRTLMMPGFIFNSPGKRKKRHLTGYF